MIKSINLIKFRHGLLKELLSIFIYYILKTTFVKSIGLYFIVISFLLIIFTSPNLILYDLFEFYVNIILYCFTKLLK